MVTCPNCGIDNPDSRLFCAVCGTQLREESPPPAEPTPPAPTSNTDSLFPDWLTTPGSTGALPTPKKSALPSWLQGAEVEPAPTPPAPKPAASSPQASPVVAEPPSAATPPPMPVAPVEDVRPKARETLIPTPSGKPETWDDHLDFSDLPEWETESAEESSPIAEPDMPKEPPMGSVETQGLLAGVTGAIPIEPIIRQSRRVPLPLPSIEEEPPSADTDEATNLFAQIAGGAVRPDPITVPRSAALGTGFLHLLLLVAVVGGVLLKLGGWELFNPPTSSPMTQAFGASLADIPRDATVLLAIDYDGAVLDELNPSLVTTFNQLRSTAPEGEVLVVSSSPVGESLAWEAWRDSVDAVGGKTEWNDSVGYVTGGIIGQRLTFAQHPADLVLIVAGDSTALQRLIEQSTAIAPERPVVAIVPASAEVMLRPYLASGQVDGAIASLTDSAAYEWSQGDGGSTAWARLDTVTLAALVIVLAMVVGWVRK